MNMTPKMRMTQIARMSPKMTLRAFFTCGKKLNQLLNPLLKRMFGVAIKIKLDCVGNY